jgi:adenylylsulfate kinase
MQKILIMGLPGSGKTTLAQDLVTCLVDADQTVLWLNADQVRKQFDDWDFTVQGRLRQAHRMRELADKSQCNFVVCDFIAPLVQMRDIFQPNWLVWLDTIDQGRYEDTNAMFEAPALADFHITVKDSKSWSTVIAQTVIQLAGKNF